MASQAPEGLTLVMTKSVMSDQDDYALRYSYCSYEHRVFTCTHVPDVHSLTKLQKKMLNNITIIGAEMKQNAHICT